MHKKKHMWCSIMIVLIVAFDQITKLIAKSNLADGKAVAFIPKIAQFRYAENTGMAFSMLSGARWIFIVLTIIFCMAILVYLFSNKCKNLWIYWSIAVVASGGIGNLVDRIFRGYVIDFIEPVFMDFAVFNIADCAVTCGAAVLIIYLVLDLFKKEKSDV